MQKVFEHLGALDKRCYDSFFLTEDILMENAANGLANFVKERFERNKKILIVAGSGNNGGDGIACARILHGEYFVDLFLHKEPKSPMARLQLARAKALGVQLVDTIGSRYDIIIDALFGSGLKDALDSKTLSLLRDLNTLDGYKIACDIPSGIDSLGRIQGGCFKADATVTMGAQKLSLYLDEAKDFVGEIHVANLGIAREKYETETSMFLLDLEDLHLPIRTKQNTHKGEFGHTIVAMGEKEGAALIGATAALRFGAGLVSVVCDANTTLPPYLMRADSYEKADAIAAGMGLGKMDDALFSALLKKPCVIDADIFYKHEILEILKNNTKIILTPHPKEFASLLKITGIGEYSVEFIQHNRFSLSQTFCDKYKNCILMLKGANTLIAGEGKLFINPHGTPVLAKGGSGDMLSGLIVSLLAQGYSPLDAACNASLALAKCSMLYEFNNYYPTALDMVEELKRL